MFARIVSGQATPGGFDDLVDLTEEQLPSAEAQPGFKGFCLLTDRAAGTLVTISLWDTREDLGNVEAGAARRHNEEAASVEVEPNPAQTYEVEVARLPFHDVPAGGD